MATRFRGLYVDDIRCLDAVVGTDHLLFITPEGQHHRIPLYEILDVKFNSNTDILISLAVLGAVFVNLVVNPTTSNAVLSIGGFALGLGWLALKKDKLCLILEDDVIQIRAKHKLFGESKLRLFMDQIHFAQEQMGSNIPSMAKETPNRG